MLDYFPQETIQALLSAQIKSFQANPATPTTTDPATPPVTPPATDPATPADPAIATTGSGLDFITNPVFMHLIVIAVGVLYNFFGGKFYPILHGFVCGLIFFLLSMAILPQPIGLIIGFVAAGLGGYQCKTMKKFQAFILAFQLGFMASVIINVVLLTWWSTNLYLNLALTATISIGGGYFGMHHAKDTISFCTAIVGSGYITSGFFGLLGYKFGAAFNLVFFLGLGCMAGLIYAGFMFQHHKHYDEIKHDHGDGKECKDEHHDDENYQKEEAHH